MKKYKEKKNRKHTVKGENGKKRKSVRARGIFQSTQAGFGFVKTEDGEEYFIPPDSTGSAMNGDTVEVHMTRPPLGKKSAEGEISRVIERMTDTIVGTFEAGNRSRRTGEPAYGFVIPDNRHYTDDIFVRYERSKGASDGDKVVVHITEYGNRSRRRKSEGLITEILGTADTPGVDITSLVRSYGLPERFPKEVIREADEAARSEEDRLKGRRDLRDILTITIDGDDSKDFDDAVSLIRKNDGYELGVHIADVSEYVKEGSGLDAEAYRRGTSVYLPDRVIPMLPEILSNDLCSLNPGEDRLTLSCIMTLDEKGKPLKAKITESVIKSRYRMTYANVQKILDGDVSLSLQYEDIVPMLKEMAELSRLIRHRREKHGAVDFDLPEAEILLGEDGKTRDVRIRERNDATRLIEDFMLLANETVARTFFEKDVPFLYRIHDNPDEEGIRDLAFFAMRFGCHLKMKKDGRADGKELQKLLRDAEGSDAERLIRTLLLRTMSQAKYSNMPKGHFALAMEHYTHFTSPIRRYPDLQIHRIIKESLRSKLTEKRKSHYEGLLGAVAERSGFLERRADDVEREADKLKMVEYMQSHIGDEYDGIISGVTEWGIYVELDNCIEGMVPLRDMTDDYYELVEEYHQVKGRALHRTYTLGDPVRVKVIRADKLESQIDFEIRY